ncbi:MAG: hypothetical protein WBD01_06085 [Salaquimonas sp.]
METLISSISPEKIFALPIIVYGPGLFLIFLFLVRFIRSLFSLRLVTAFTSLIYAFVFAVLLSHLAPVLVQMYGLDDPQPTEHSYFQNIPDNRNQRLS